MASQSGFAAKIVKPRGVVELFTSQGCSSCPPADKVLAELADEEEVLALSWHVDYWDYLGWKDKFATAAFTERQYRYAKSLGERQVYTPQAIVNGRIHLNGSDGSTIRDLVRNFEASGGGLTVPILAEINGDSISVRIQPGSVEGHATLWLAYFNSRETVNIERGENTGKTITYRNTIHEFQLLGMVKEGGLTVELPENEMKRSGYDSCAVIVQSSDPSGNPGPISGAVIIKDL